MVEKIVIAYEYQDIKEQFRRMLSFRDIPLVFIQKIDELVKFKPEEVLCIYISQNFDSKPAFEVLDILREKSPNLLKVPLTILAIDKTNAFAISAMRKGFQAVVSRPIERRKVFESLKSACAARGVELPQEFNFGSRGISENEKLEFIRYLINQSQNNLLPVYSKACQDAYYYPRLTIFFNLEMGQEKEILREMVRNNIFHPELVNKVNLCPKCSWHTINYRENCPRCKSLRIDIQEVYHHFSCGYVGPAEDFRPKDKPEALICPKCHNFLRNIGLDYEKPTETFLCMDCHYVFNDPDLSFNCFNCSYIGDASEAVIVDIFRYTMTQKAWDVVEQGSLTIKEENSEIMDKYGCVSPEAFLFTVARRSQECSEFGDQIFLLFFFIDTKSDDTTIDIVHLIITEIGHKGFVTYPVDNVMAIVMWRVDIEYCQNFARKIITEAKGKDTDKDDKFNFFIKKLDSEKTLSESEVATMLEDSIESIKKAEHSEDVNIL